MQKHSSIKFLPAANRNPGKNANRVLRMLSSLITFIILSLLTGIVFVSTGYATAGQEHHVRQNLSSDTAHILALIDSGIKYSSINPGYCRFFTLRALKLSEKINYTKGIALARYSMGILEYLQGNYNKALTYLEMSERGFNKINFTGKTPDILNTRGSICLKQFKYEDAMDCYYHALHLQEIARDPENASITLLNIGSLCLRMEDFPKARYYITKALSGFLQLKLGDKINLAYVNLGTYHAEIQNNDSALYYFKMVDEYYARTNKNVVSRAPVLISIGNLYRRLRQFDKSILSLTGALQLSEKIGMKEFYGKSLTELALTYQETGQDDLAVKYAKEGLKTTTATGQLINTRELYQLLFSVYKHKNQVALALQSLEELNKVKDSLQKANNLELLKKMDSRYLTDKLQQQELFLQQQKDLFRTRQVQFYLVLFLISLVLVFVLIIFYVKQQAVQRRNKILEQETEINRQKAIIHDQENALYEAELNKHRQEILAISTLQGKTNETVLQIIHDLREMALKEIGNKMVSSSLYMMASKIEKLSVTDSWFDFRKWFTDIHPHFYENLNKICPSLTNNDLKLASLIRMNLTSKEIAALTLRSLDSIHIARYRLRKKLEIDDDDKLANFLFSVASFPEKPAALPDFSVSNN
jgi:tetratricopeptide (TPR) repeat protein